MKLQGPVDFCIYFKNVEETLKTVNYAFKIGFNTIIISLTFKEEENLKNLVNKAYEVKNIIENYNLKYNLKNVFLRVHLIGSSISWFKNCLRKIRYRFHIISAKPLTINSFRFAGRDRRIDVIVYENKNLSRFFDKSQMKLMKNSEKALEIQFNSLWSSSNYKGLIFNLRRTLSLALRSNVPIIISSGSSTLNNIKTPYQLMSLLTILGIPYPYAKLTISTIPLSIIRRNIHRLSKKHVEIGVDIV